MTRMGHQLSAYAVRGVDARVRAAATAILNTYGQGDSYRAVRIAEAVLAASDEWARSVGRHATAIDY